MTTPNTQKRGTVGNPIVCYDWPEAFDTVREAGRPFVFQVGTEVGRCFPSGKYDLIKNESAAFLQTAWDQAVKKTYKI